MTAWSHTISLGKKPLTIIDLQLHSRSYDNLAIGTKLCDFLSICVTCMLVIEMCTTASCHLPHFRTATFSFFILILICRENSLTSKLWNLLSLRLIFSPCCTCLSYLEFQFHPVCQSSMSPYQWFVTIFLNKKLVCFSEYKLRWARKK